MKDLIKNLLSTTALTLIAISLIAWAMGDTSVNLLSILPSIIANIVIHLGLLVVRWFDVKNYITELAIEAAFVVTVVLAVGFFVGWFTVFPVWLTIGIALVVFMIACFINVRQVRQDMADINDVIGRIKESHPVVQ